MEVEPPGLGVGLNAGNPLFGLFLGASGPSGGVQLQLHLDGSSTLAASAGFVFFPGDTAASEVVGAMSKWGTLGQLSVESEMATGFKSAELSLPSLTVSPLSNRVPLGFKKLKASYAAETGAWTGEATLFSVPSGVPGLMFGPVESDVPSLTVKGDDRRAGCSGRIQRGIGVGI